MQGLIVSGNAGKELAEKICSLIGVKQGRVEILRFPDNEAYCRFEEPVKGKKVFVLQPTSSPANENLMELLLIIDAAKRSGAKKIIAVIPYYGYARQDRQAKKGEPVSAALVAELLKAAGANLVISMDLHSKKAKGFLKKKKHLHALPAIIEFIEKKNLKELCVVAPDKGALENAKKQAKMLKAEFALIEKKRIDSHKVVMEKSSGNVKGKNCIIIDDIISTAGTICEAAEFLKKSGAKNIFVAATHGVLAGKAIEKLKKAPVKEVIVTDTIPQKENLKKLKKLKVASVAGIFANEIKKWF